MEPQRLAYPWTEASGILSEGLGCVLNPSPFTAPADLPGPENHISLQTKLMYPLTKL